MVNYRMRRRACRFASLILTAIVVVSFALPGCSVGNPCGSCDPKTHFCIGYSTNATCPQNYQYQCEPFPSSCAATPDCACFTPLFTGTDQDASCDGTVAAGLVVMVMARHC